MFIDKFISQDIKVIFSFNNKFDTVYRNNLYLDISQSVVRESPIKSSFNQQQTLSRDVAWGCRDQFNLRNSASPKRETDRSLGDGAGPGPYRGPDGTLHIRKGWTPGKKGGISGNDIGTMPCQRTPPKLQPKEKAGAKGSPSKGPRGRKINRGKSSTVVGRNGKIQSSELLENKAQEASSYLGNMFKY